MHLLTHDKKKCLDGLRKYLDLQVSVKDASAMAIINCIDKLLEILPCFILFKSPIMSLEIIEAIKPNSYLQKMLDVTRQKCT